MSPKRGEVFWVAFDPSIGGEIQKTRPAVVVSNDAANQTLNRLIVVPISSKVDRIYPGEVLVNINKQPGKAMSDQLTTISRIRLKSRVATVTPEELGRIERALLLQLGIRT